MPQSETALFRLAACLAVVAVLFELLVGSVIFASAYPLQAHGNHGRRVVRSTRPGSYYPDVYVSAGTLYPDEYDEDADYAQEQWFDSAASDPAANAAFLQNLMEANKYGLGMGPTPGRYLDPRYRESDDYVFGSVNSGTSSGSTRRGYDQPSAPATYGRYQYHVTRQDDDDDADVRELHALAKKSPSAPSRTEEQRLQELEAQALLAAALARQREREAREQEARRTAAQRAEEFSGDANDLAELADLLDLDQGLERLFARSGIPNQYREEPRRAAPAWNAQGFYMEDALPVRQTRSRGNDNSRQKSSRPKSTAAPTTTKAPATTTSTTTTATPPTAAPSSATATAAPSKRMLSSGQMGGQPEVALLRPAAPRAAPRPAPRAATRPHQGGVDEIRNLLRVQDTMGGRAPGHGDLLSLLPNIAKRSVAKTQRVVSDEGSLVDELSALKRRAD